MALSTDQSDILTLWYLVNASLSSYHKLLKTYGSPALAVRAGTTAWQTLGMHNNHISRLEDNHILQTFLHDVATAISNNVYQVVFLGDKDYPSALAQLYDPPPVLFYRGNIQRLNQTQIAIVGSRKPSDYAQKMTFDIAQYLVQCGYVITSGLAQGIDTYAHQGALAQSTPSTQGYTVGVMGTGIDICYPKNNESLFDTILQQGGCLVSELLPKTPASKHTFPRRNRLIAGLSVATIVTEAAIQSGSLITARLAAEQGKQVFALPNRIDNAGAEGCHHLIREGATLIYHPLQVIDDVKNQALTLPTHFSKADSLFGQSDDFYNNPPPSPKHVSTHQTKPQHTQSTPLIALPEHLQALFEKLSDTPQDIDTLIDKTGITTADLLVQLTELEILGLITQIGGRYAKI